MSFLFGRKNKEKSKSSEKLREASKTPTTTTTTEPSASIKPDVRHLSPTEFLESLGYTVLGLLNVFDTKYKSQRDVAFCGVVKKLGSPYEVVKVGDKKGSTPWESNPTLKHEYETLKALSHPNILSAGTIYLENNDYVFYSHELVTGNNLFVQMDSWMRPFAEYELVVLFRQIFSALRLMHQHRLHMHVNATHEGIRFKSQDPECREIKLVDIGHDFYREECFGTAYGSAHYYTTSAEIFDGSTMIGDILAIGIMLLILICQFESEQLLDEVSLCGMMEAGFKRFTGSLNKLPVSEELKSFLMDLCSAEYSFLFLDHIEGPNRENDVDNGTLLRHPWQYTQPNESNTAQTIACEPLHYFLKSWSGRTYSVYRCSGTIIPPNTTLWDYELSPKAYSDLIDAMWQIRAKFRLLVRSKKDRESLFYPLPTELFVYIFSLFDRLVM